MARPITLSNGELSVSLDDRGMVQDFTFPHVGLENHTPGDDIQHRVGVWVDGNFSWLSDDGWQINQRYPHSALIGHTKAVNESLGVALEFDDFVDSSISAFLRNIHVVNLSENPRQIRLFFSQAFLIGNSTQGADTAQYLPEHDAILHYHGRRAFVVSGDNNGKPFDQYTVGIFGSEGREGTYRDAEDGELSFSTAEHGRVDSTIGFTFDLSPHSSIRVHYWIAAGTSMREALYVNNNVKDDGLLERQRTTADWWHDWLKPAHEVVLRIDKPYRESFIHSLMILRSHFDKHGAVIASVDTSNSGYSRDTYSYCWPRDGALSIWPLIRLGYVDEPRRFFEFCRRVMQPEGYLMHRYRPDGAPGSSWHPYVQSNGQKSLPIQEDETALVLFMLAQFYQKTKDDRMLKDFYQTLVLPMAEFLADHIDSGAGLPLPSYDLWEETYQTTTFTTSAVYGALVAASELATVMEDDSNAVTWRSVADDIRVSANKYLYNSDRQAFYRGVSIESGEVVSSDETVDVSSFFGAFMFGLFAGDSPEVSSAAKTTEELLGFDYERPAMSRYEGDRYCQAVNGVSNFWPIASLWMAQYELEIGNNEVSRQTIDWIKQHMLPTGALPEQLNPSNGQPVSVTPLAWSHAEYLATLLDTITEVSE